MTVQPPNQTANQQTSGPKSDHPPASAVTQEGGAGESSHNGERIRVLLVTGLSGAGKSSALKALEDIGYEAVDNLPLALLPNLIALADDNPDHVGASTIAIGIDTRTRAFRADRFEAELARLRALDTVNLTLVFLECSDDLLARRFTETRRRHPMATDRPVRDGILRERETMEVVRANADYIFDTTDLSVQDLKRTISQTFQPQAGDARLTVTVASFAYPRGLPHDADLVFDVRFLRNPHYDKDLRPFSGRNPRVAAYIEEDPAFPPFIQQLETMVISLLPLYEREGKAYLTIAFGCTGGRHRSVFMTERLAALLHSRGYKVNVLHRELERAREISDTVLGDVL